MCPITLPSWTKSGDNNQRQRGNDHHRDEIGTRMPVGMPPKGAILDDDRVIAKRIGERFEKYSRTSLTSSGATVVVATGRLDFHAADALRHQLHGCFEAGVTRVVIDLSGVTSIDSSGVGALIFGLKSARSAGGDLLLAAPTKSVAGILAMMNLTEVLVACESPELAFPATLKQG